MRTGNTRRGAAARVAVSPRSGRVAAVLVAALAASACSAAGGRALPSEEDVLSYYTTEREVRAEIVGNVAVLSVAQDAQQLRRGGNLWAKVGPYVFLFSEETKQLLEDYEGLGGVRVTTTVGRAEVASALLAHAELNDVLWARSLNIAGKARLGGTNRMTLVEDLVDWGEAHTEYTYNETYTNR